jgi:cytochrome c biogenesis protein CcdA
MLEYALALAAGMATIVSPCILPILPIVLASTAARSKAEPLFIILGFVVTFAAGGILLGVLADSAGELSDNIRTAALLLLLAAGVACVLPNAFDRLTSFAMRAFGTGSSAVTMAPSQLSVAGALMIGASLGLAWTPCAGPVLASVLALAASSQAAAESTALLGMYAIGAGVPLLAIAYGGNFVTTRVRRLAPHAQRIRQAFGVFAIATALLQLFQYDAAFFAWATQGLPAISRGL